LRVLDLFSGIGGFSLGLERAGMHTVAFCEIDPYCRAVLRKHWPNVPVHGDVRELTADVLGLAQGNGWGARRPGRPDPAGTGECEPEQSLSIDVICGGFPCQDISVAGKGAGIEGERSGLWSQYARVVGEVRPRYVIVENVAALLGRGLDQVLGDLAALGFDAEWHCIPASAVGAPHRRDRIWIVAYATGDDECGMAADQGGEGQRWHQSGNGGSHHVAHAGWLTPQRFRSSVGEIGEPDWWLSEPDVGRVAHGIPARVDRLRALGNAIVPQIAEIIGRAIMKADR
jgi:DNA (cytosine-5)-methyltransferase 1